MTNTTFEYDVFLSHTSKDTPGVEKIARMLLDAYELEGSPSIWHLIPSDILHQDVGQYCQVERVS